MSRRMVSEWLLNPSQDNDDQGKSIAVGELHGHQYDMMTSGFLTVGRMEMMLSGVGNKL